MNKVAIILLLSVTCVLSQSDIRCSDCKTACLKCCQIPIKGECHKYCFCTEANSISFVVECDEGQAFNPETRVCESLEEYSCPLPLDCRGRPNGNYPYPGKCTQFITCSNEHPTVQDCPSELHFCDRPTCNPPRCAYHYEAKCENEQIDNTVCQEGEFYLNSRDCSQYYLCAGNQLRSFRCPSGLHFSAVSQRCDHAELAKCTSKRTLALNTGAPSLAPATQSPTLECTKPDGVYRLPGSPALQAVCRNGTANIIKIPQPQQTNIARKSLNDAEHGYGTCRSFYDSHFNQAK